MLDLARLLPPPETQYQGPRGPWLFFIAMTVVATARSLVHMSAQDGGAQSIAGLVVDGPGGANLVAIFAQWGASQLLLAMTFWLVMLRYRAFVPLMLLFVALEQFLRLSVGLLKPVIAVGTPPGAVGSEILLPVTIAMLVWSLKGQRF